MVRISDLGFVRSERSLSWADGQDRTSWGHPLSPTGIKAIVAIVSSTRYLPKLPVLLLQMQCKRARLPCFLATM